MFIQKIVSIVSASALILSMAGCASGYGYHNRDYASAGVDYDGFYDDYYGPVADGYWGSDGAFRYTDAPGHPFKRDDAQHFRRDAAQNFHPVHGHHNGPTEDRR